MQDYIIANGETLSNQNFGYGDTILVQSGGTLSDSVISKDVVSVTLEDEAILAGSIRTAKEISVSGSVNAASAELDFDLSDRKPEDEIFLNNLFDMQSISISVSPDQDKGTYRLFGNAADFADTITVQSSLGAILGTLSIEDNVLDYDITRYTLSLNEANEVCVTVSSNIPDTSDYVLLYKDGELVATAKSVDGITISSEGQYDKVAVLKSGVLTNSTLDEGGHLVIYSGARVTGLTDNSGNYNLSLIAGDGTVFNGTNEFGTFSYENGYAENLHVGKNSTVNVYQGTELHNFYLKGNLWEEGSNVLNVYAGGTISGAYAQWQMSAITLHEGAIGRNLKAEYSGAITSYFNVFGGSIYDSELIGVYFDFEDAYVENTTISPYNNPHVSIKGYNIFKDVTISGDAQVGSGYEALLTLAGNLTLSSSIQYFSAFVDARGNTIIIDLTGRDINSGAFVNLSVISEDAKYRLNVKPAQIPGKYQFAHCFGPLADTFSVYSGDEFVGTLSVTNNEVTNGDWKYTLVYDEARQIYSLDIGVSDTISDDKKVWYWDSNGNAYSGVSFDRMTIGADDCKTVYVLNDGVLTDSTLDEDGRLLICSGAQITGLTDNTGNYNLSLIAGDGTVFKGTNEFGTFSYENGYAENLYIGLNSTVNVYQDTELHIFNLKSDLWDAGNNVLNVYAGGTISGEYSQGQTTTITLDEGAIGRNLKAEYSGAITSYFNVFGGSIYDSELIGVYFDFEDAYVENTTISPYNNPHVSIKGYNIFKDVTISGKAQMGGGLITLEGNLTLSSSIQDFSAFVDAHGNTIIIDLTERNINSDAFVNIANISEDAKFRLNIKPAQIPGKYQFAYNAGSFIDTFSVYSGDEFVGALSVTNNEVTNGDWKYTLVYDEARQIYSLDIGVSDTISDDKKVWYWDSNGNAYSGVSFDRMTIGADDCKTVYVLNDGVLTDSTLDEGGQLLIYSGAQITGLTDNTGNYNLSLVAGDGTVFKGTNEFGTFSYENGYAENLHVGKNSTVIVYQGTELHNFYLKGNLWEEGSNVLNVYAGGTISGAYAQWQMSAITLHEGAIGRNLKAEYSGAITSYFNVFGGSIYDSELIGVYFDFEDAYVENTTISPYNNPHVSLRGNNIFKDVTISGDAQVEHDGLITLEGSLTLSSSIQYFTSLVDAHGNTIIIDLTERNINSGAFLGVANIYNSEFCLRLANTPLVGGYRIGYSASKISQGDPKGVYNWDTNKWDFKGEVIGDMDGIIEIRDENGILLANCTVNGDTEYFGRYNYTVRVDDSGDMYLDVGWNTREGRTYAADGYDNLTLVTAAMLPEAGTKLTIDSADDVDWFQFTLDTVGRKSSYIGIEFKHWAGDLDLYLYDAKGNQLDYSKSVTDNERISLRGLAAGDYYIKVEGYEGNVNEYKLAYKLPEPVVLTDAYENGDTKAHSYHLGKLSEQITLKAAISRADDQDYYKFHLPKKGLTCDTITLTYDEDFGDLDLYLYGSNGMTLLATALNTSGGLEQISLAGLKHGEYYVAVKSKDGSVGNYQLLFDVNAHEVNPDKYENNNSLKKATNLYTLNGNQSLAGLSIHQNESKNDKEADPDVDYYKFSILEKGSVDDWISISYEVCLGDLDLEILNADGEVVAWSRTAENEDTVSLKGFEVGDYYIRVSGYNSNVANNYTLSWNVTNSSLIPSDSYEGMEPIAIRENQTVTGLSIAKPVKEDETRADTFKIVLEYDAWKRSKIILTDYRSDWEDGMKYVIRDADDNILKEGKDSEISLSGLKKGEYYLTVDAPNDDEYSEYSLIAQSLPDSDNPKDNTWSFFIYLAGDNNLEGAYLTELLYMQRAVLPENVEVYVLLDRSEDYSTAQRNWTDTRVGKIRHSKGGAVAVEWMYFDGVNTNTYMNTQNLELKQEWDTGDVDTLEAFLDWGMKVGRADNYALIVKDHGSSLGYNCQDDTDGSMMAIEEIADLLRADKYKDLSVVAFDQCLMGSDVVITTMEGTVDYVVASEAVGYTPNLLVMYKVLLNSFETEMSPRDVSQKIVAACNCSGLVDLTLASFKTDGHALSDALQAFGEAAKGFTREDWVAICKTFATAYNYGDEYWAYSDLGSFLSTLKEYSTSISGTLMEATENLYDVVLNQIIDSTMITPTVYGSGLAVFNPVLSNDVISFYATEIGQTAWGDFLRTTGQLSEDCTEFFVDTRTNLTFTDFSYSIEDEAVQVTYNLGTFTGNGVEYNGLYMDKKACFTISLENAGIEGDAIRVVADNPDANITIKLIQEYGGVRRVSKDGVLSLDGIDPAKAGVDTEYDLIITSDKETTYSLSFEANWTSGSDYFDYSRSGSLGAQGNGSIDKATKLAAGNYGGLVTYAGDPDFYQLNTVYSDTLSVTVNGTGLSVQEYDADGLFVQNAEYADGKYTITVANGNYLRVEGSADLAPDSNQVNSYSLYIRDVSSTYLSLGGTEIQLPEKPIVVDELKDNQVTVTLNLENGMKGYHSSDLQIWDVCEDDTFVATDNGLYYFKSVDPETKLESQYTSLRIVGIDHVAPTVSNVTADVTNVTNGDVIVTAEFTDDVALASSLYRIGETGDWLEYEYENGVLVKENTTVFFKAVDVAGNESEVASYSVTNIDKTAPVIEYVGDNVTPLQQASLTVNVDDGSDIYYSTDQQNWTKYTGKLDVTANATYYFKATDAAGNTGTNSITFENIDTDAPVITLTGDNITPLQQTTLTATVDDGSPIYYRIGDSGEWTEYKEPITVTDNATYNFLSTDAAGNEGTNFLSFANIIQAPISDVVPQTQTWEKVEEATQYIVEYSTDNFEHVIQMVVDSNSLDSFQMPAGNYQMRVKPEDGEWTVLDSIVASEAKAEPKLVKSNADGNADVFFANPVGTWEAGYLAQHVGSINDWAGTNEYASVYEKNKLADIIEGSNDANILLMTDDDNGDSLFVDDIYTVLPGSVSEQQSRIAQIDEIRAGAGNDIVDMTSNKFEYTGDGMTIRGGDGDDTIWANKGNNWLFGDAGNDRIVGASGNDVIVGGIGNDRMHGGGGNDVFTFCDNWGTDTVEQLATGSVTLWFASGSMENWNAETLTYTDGENSVKVSGIAADKITLKFGDDGSDQFTTLSSVGAFADFTSQKIFEKSGKGILASM